MKNFEVVIEVYNEDVTEYIKSKNKKEVIEILKSKYKNKIRDIVRLTEIK